MRNTSACEAHHPCVSMCVQNVETEPCDCEYWLPRTGHLLCVGTMETSCPTTQRAYHFTDRYGNNVPNVTQRKGQSQDLCAAARRAFCARLPPRMAAWPLTPSPQGHRAPGGDVLRFLLLLCVMLPGRVLPSSSQGPEGGKTLNHWASNTSAVLAVPPMPFSSSPGQISV